MEKPKSEKRKEMYRRRRGRPRRGATRGGRGGKRRGRKGTGRRTTSRVRRTRVRSRRGRYEVGRKGNVVKRERGGWMEAGEYEVKWGLRYDSLTVRMCVIVRTVAGMVHRYSREYMGEDPHRTRFMSYLSRFTFGMLRLVTADNRVQMFVGWEGVGVCSYRRINFWYTRIQANKAAIKAMLVNRVGDIGLGAGRRRRYEKYGGREYGRVYGRGGTEGGEGERRRAGLGRRVGGMGKSAQLGRHTWLPDAMEGPTPVSALIHAATMVTAGVYRRARSSPVLEYAPEVRKRVTRVGGGTARYAGTVGRVQNDRKRVIAYSTCSQLGYMVMACGRSGYEVAVFHLGTHARFKGLLFLSAGAVIHARGDEQDMRRMGGLGKVRPRTYARMRIGSVALMGFPYRAGYYSKDRIMEVAYGSYGLEGHRGYWLGLGGAYCTGRYSRRRRQRTFLGEVGGYRKRYEGVHEAPRKMGRAMRVLSRGGIWGGWRRKDGRVGRGTNYWGQAIYVHPEGRKAVEGENRNGVVKRRPVRVGRRGGGTGRRRYERKGKERYGRKRERKERYKFRNKKWYFDKVYTERVGVKVRKEGYERTYKGRDRGRIERRGPSGGTKRRYERGKRRGKRQTGEIGHYTGRRVYGRGGRRRVGRRRKGREEEGEKERRRRRERRRGVRRRYRGREKGKG